MNCFIISAYRYLIFELSIAIVFYVFMADFQEDLRPHVEFQEKLAIYWHKLPSSNKAAQSISILRLKFPSVYKSLLI